MPTKRAVTAVEPVAAAERLGPHRQVADAGGGHHENLETRADTGNTARGPSERRVTYELGTAPGLPPLDTGGGILYTLFGT